MVILILGIARIPWRNRPYTLAELVIWILLHHLSASGEQLKDEIKIFGRSQSYVSLVFNDVLVYRSSQFREFLFWDKERLSLQKISNYTKAIEKVVGGSSIWGWIDGTMRPFCRPGENQAYYYSGHKKAHSFQFQSIMTPDGIMSSLHGPYMGLSGDWMIWNNSGLEGILRNLFGARLEQP